MELLPPAVKRPQLPPRRTLPKRKEAVTEEKEEKEENEEREEREDREERGRGV